MNSNEHGWKNKNISVSICVHLWLISLVLLLIGCSELEKPKPEPFYAETTPPPKQEFRWSNGKMPKSFDPALASAAPETDVARAIYEGLTETDSKTLNPVPAVAEKWESSEDFKTWTFHLRKNAKWSNGETVTAADFVRSWKRLADMGEKVSHHKLLKNVVGMRTPETIALTIENEEIDSVSRQSADLNPMSFKSQTNSGLAKNSSNTKISASPEKTETKPKKEEAKFGVEAIDEYTLKISLIKPDKEFPALVAHPIFLPVHGDGKHFETGNLSSDIVTNGAFRIFSVGQDGVTLDRADYYWNRENVELERVRFVPQESAEKALEAYRAGEIDAVTNADFQPLALKLLTPFDDFQRTTHSAINFYEINRKKPPFDDRRVREALAISIERERLTEGEMEGVSEPALSFMPFEEENKTKLVQDTGKAKQILAEAGFPNGENFPPVKLVVNRNNVQQRIARSVAKMWKENLNIETEIIVKESAEIESVKKTGDFDVIRRGVVIPTSDETANMLAIFAPKKEVKETDTKKDATAAESKADDKSSNEKSAQEKAVTGELQIQTFETLTPETGEMVFIEYLDETSEAILTEEQALIELPAIPLYFPTSYSLVKPYVLGFEINTLDAPSLKNVRINNN